MTLKLLKACGKFTRYRRKVKCFTPKENLLLLIIIPLILTQQGPKKKLKPNFNKTFSSSFDEINFEIRKNNGLIYLSYITETNNWKETIKKLTKKELVISNNKFEYHYKRFEIN